MNVFTYLFNFATKGATRIKFHLFNFFTHLIILGITDNFTTKGILLAYASFILNFFCGEFLFFRINKVLEGLERLIYANQLIDELEEETESSEESENNSEEQDEETESSEEDQELKERIRSEVNF